MIIRIIRKLNKKTYFDGWLQGDQQEGITKKKIMIDLQKSRLNQKCDNLKMLNYHIKITSEYSTQSKSLVPSAEYLVQNKIESNCNCMQNIAIKIMQK